MPDAAMLRRVLSETERNVLTMAGGGANSSSIDTQLRLSPGTAAEMLPRIRRKVEAAARQHRDERAQRIRVGDELSCACGEKFIARSLSQRKCPACREMGPEVPERDIVDAALDAAGVPAEQADTIRVGSASGQSDDAPVGPPIPPAEPADTFDGEPEEPPVADDLATESEAAENGNGAGPWQSQRERAEQRRARIVRMLREEPRSVKRLAVELETGLEAVRSDLTILEREQLAERSGERLYDWPGAPPEGSRIGKPSVGWRPWTGAGAPKEGERAEEPKQPVEPEPEVPAQDPERAQVVSSAQVVELPRDRAELHWFYLGVLFELAKIRPEAAHVFDRIERLMADGPPASGAEA